MAEAALAPAAWRRVARGLAPRPVLLNLLVGLVSLGMVVPLVWAISSSFKPEGEIFEIPPRILPRAATLENYAVAFASVPIVTAYLNTVTVTVSATVRTLDTSSLAAYAFARLRFRGRDACFFAVIATMMVPSQRAD